MKKIRLTRNKFAIVDNEDFEILNKYKWSVLKGWNTSYAVRSLYDSKTQKTSKTLLMHRVILNLKNKEICDHVNGNGLDNRKNNLRLVTKSQNSINSKINIRNKSGYKGVSWDKLRKKWTSRIKVNGKYLFLGRFDSKSKAMKEYNKKAKEEHGVFFNPNNFKKYV